MCGILAILDRFGAPPLAASHAVRGGELLERLRHRGPDGCGTSALPHGWLGHRRLAIVGDGTGAQPLRHGDVTWVANGEIFNHVDLRRLYGAAASTSDCAVVGAAWRAAGDDFAALLDGQFAIVCSDGAGRWIAARDHAGVSPLYAGWHEDGTVWFASEMKALIDDCARVELVAPGTAWCSDERGFRRVTWYAPAWQHTVPDRRADPACIRAALVAAVRKRLMSDVPWGVLLSGGLDSSLVASIATRLCREAGLPPPRSFSIGLEGAPDLIAARRVAHFLGCDHHEFTFSLDEALALIPRAVYQLESYQQIRTAVPTMILAERVRAHGVKMVLSGEGADEIFGGYLYFHAAPSAAAFHEETVRKTLRLHQYDVMRANKAPMAHGVELRFPFLDRALMDLVLSIDPRDRMVGPDGIEKRVLRHAFDDAECPWLPAEVLWRQKEQFSDGVGYAWVDTVRTVAAERAGRVGSATLSRWFPEDTPRTPEMQWMREIFEGQFVEGRAAGRSSLATVGTGLSIACSTPEAVAWNPEWSSLAGDISGRAIGSVHAAAAPLR
ncbi:MAG TPA: asparagine synthase B [Vicinamibacterales bacterium]|nr:asparagine synthase B [Vicinamibacterales bacterium]